MTGNRADQSSLPHSLVPTCLPSLPQTTSGLPHRHREAAAPWSSGPQHSLPVEDSDTNYSPSVCFPLTVGEKACLVLSCLLTLCSLLLLPLRPQASGPGPCKPAHRGKCENTVPFSLRFFLPSSPRDGQCYGFSQTVQRTHLKCKDTVTVCRAGKSTKGGM